MFTWLNTWNEMKLPFFLNWDLEMLQLKVLVLVPVGCRYQTLERCGISTAMGCSRVLLLLLDHTKCVLK